MSSKPVVPKPCSVSILFPLLLVSFAWCIAVVVSWIGDRLLTQSAPSEVKNNGTVLNVQIVKDMTAASAITQAERAIVFVDAPYSSYALRNGQRFLRGTLYLSQETPLIGAEVFWIENDAEDWFKDWIAALGVDELMDVAVPVGNGAILWMEAGKVVRFQLGHEIRGPDEIKEFTLELWKDAN